jgi:hypothetical protein
MEQGKKPNHCDVSPSLGSQQQPIELHLVPMFQPMVSGIVQAFCKGVI